MQVGAFYYQRVMNGAEPYQAVKSLMHPVDNRIYSDYRVSMEGDPSDPRLGNRDSRIADMRRFLEDMAKFDSDRQEVNFLFSNDFFFI